MKKFATIFIMIVLGISSSVQSQSFCNDEFNYVSGQPLNSYFNYPGIGGGYLFGHNGLLDRSKAELITNPYASASLTSAKLKFAVAKTNNPNATISVKVWDNTGIVGGIGGTSGGPGAVLRTQTVLINTIPTGGADLMITFTPALTVTTDIFIGITYTYAAGDTVALYANNDGLTTPGTSWEEWGPQSVPALWYPLSDAANSWGINNSLFISGELCYVCPTVTLNISGTDNTSCTTANGTVTASASGGTSPYSYTDGSSTNNNGQFTGLVGGTYNVTATDDVGCTATGSRTISNPTVSLAIANSQNNTSCLTPNGSITVTVTGGTSPYSYADGNTTNNNGQFAGLSGGTYNITVTDAAGCTATVSETITNTTPTITVTETNNTANTSCSATNGAFTVSASGGTGNFSYSGNGQTNSTGTFTGLDAGNYIVTATGSDGCSGTLSVTITTTTPTITVTETNNTTNTSCSTPNGAFTVSASGGGGNYTYAANGQSNSTGTFTGLAAGSYTVTATDANGCTGTVSVSITSSTPTITVTETNNTANTSCNTPNGAFTVSASGGASPYSYSVAGQTTNNTGTFTGLAASSYTVTATDVNGCTGTLSVTITTTTPTITVTETNNTNNTSCSTPNGAFTVSASGGAGSYTYAANGQSNLTGTFTGLAASSYTVTATDANGCSGTVSVAIINNLPVITLTEISVTPNTSCASPVGAFEVSASGGTGNYTYSILGQSNSTGIFTGLSTTTYSVTATGTDGCSGTLSVTITGTTPVITVTISNLLDNTSCGLPNGSATIEAAGGTGPYTIDVGGNVFPLNPNPFLADSVPAGTYSGVVTDANSCSGNFTFDILDNAPTVTLVEQSVTPNTFCVGVNGALIVAATTGTSPFVYTLVGPGPVSNQTGEFTNLAVSTYTVNVSDADGCTGTIDVTVTDNLPVISLIETANNPNTSCINPNGSFTVVASGGSGTYSYFDGVNNNNDGIFSGLAGSTYSIVATDSVNGCTATTSVIVSDNVATIVLSELSNSDNTSCLSPNGSFTVSASNGVSPYTYNNGISSNQDGIFSQLPAGSYSVTVTDDNGCSSTLSVSIISNTPAITVQEIANIPSTSCSTPDGSVTLDASGGTAPYSYSDGTNTNNTGIFSGLAGGNYSYTVTDSVSCTQVVSVTIANNTPNITAIPSSFNNNTGCVNANGGFNVTASGGTMPYMYDNGMTINNDGIFTGLQGGTYNVTVTDVNGCSGVVSASVTDNIPTVLVVISTTAATSATSSDGMASATVAGGITPYTYLWSNGATSSAINGVASSSYTVTVTDANGCTASATDSIGFVVGVAINISTLNFEVFPNPTQGLINVSIHLNEKTPLKFSLINMVGEVIISELFDDELVTKRSYDLSSFSDGVYIVNISNDKESIIKRVILNK